jgi:hypothetical protein
MGKKKVDIDKFQMDLMKNEVKHYGKKNPGCGQTTPWVDNQEEWVDTACGKKVNIGTGLGLVEAFCDGCGVKLCPNPAMKPLNGFPALFCAPPKERGTQIWTPNKRHDNYDPALGTGRQSALPEAYKNTKYCYLETVYFDHLDNLKTIISCRECAPEFEDEYRQIQRKKILLGG